MKLPHCVHFYMPFLFRWFPTTVAFRNEMKEWVFEEQKMQFISV